MNKKGMNLYNNMELEVLRYNSEKKYTDSLIFINCDFECYGLEDEYRTKKVYGKTRIPAGKYKIKLRNEGGFHQRYLKKFGTFHKGMLWVQDVPGFEYILIHVGNSEKDTSGCLLTGTTADKNKGFIGGSVEAYKDLYRKVSSALLKGEDVFIEYRDF